MPALPVKIGHCTRFFSVPNKRKSAAAYSGTMLPETAAQTVLPHFQAA